VVYVRVPEREQPVFQYREIVLGPEAGKFYVVEEGLDEGEEVAVNGVFKIDAAAQLAGKPSMMNPEGGKVSTGHDHGSMTGTTEAVTVDHSEPTSMGEDVKISHKFREQLEEVYQAYAGMKDAFVSTNAVKVATEAGKVSDKLAFVNMGLLKGKNHVHWMEQLKTLKNSIEKMESTNDIELQRKAFAEFNLAFYKSMKEFGLSNGTIYYQYCPMAVGNKGAYWFSNIREIENPYFGEAMLKCGETRETLTF
jgi:Cu(I)/Ag(I) efflux system membrane fusion protein